MITDILKAAANYREIKSKEFYSGDQLKLYQFKCLKKILDFSYGKIPFYRESFKKEGIKPGDIRNWDDFLKIPLLSKNEKRERSPEDFLPRGINRKKIWKTQTTGSTGIPITVFRNSQSTAWDRALNHYCFQSNGIKIYDRIAQIGAVLSEKPHHPGPFAKLGLKRNRTINLRQSDEEIIREIKDFKPLVLYSFPSVFLRLAEYINANMIDLNLRCLVAQGEVLPESWRATIEKSFHAPLYHTYGATELARIGFECAQQEGFHLIPDSAAVEILDNGRPLDFNEEGEIVVTTLNNYCSPLIRYQIGDRGIFSPSPCPCGISFPLLKNVTGRMDDFLILPSGKKVSARAVTHMQFEGILQYKIVQKSPSELQVLVIPSKNFNAGTLAEIKKVLNNAFLGEDMEVEIKTVETLPLSPTGKLQLVTRGF